MSDTAKPTPPSLAHTPARQDKSLWLILAGLASTVIAKQFGVQISSELIVELGTAAVGLYTLASKARSAYVAGKEAQAQAAVSAPAAVVYPPPAEPAPVLPVDKVTSPLPQGGPGGPTVVVGIKPGGG